MHPIRLDSIALRIDLHLGHHVVVFHIPFGDVAAVLDGFDARTEVVGCDTPGKEGGAGDEGYPGGGDVWLGGGLEERVIGGG